MGTAKAIFAEVVRGGATGNHVTGNDVTGSGPDVTSGHVTDVTSGHVTSGDVISGDVTSGSTPFPNTITYYILKTNNPFLFCFGNLYTVMYFM